MCGLYGVIGSGMQKQDTLVFESLVIANVHRGIDACGVMVEGYHKNNFQMDKKAINPVEFWGNYVSSTNIIPNAGHYAILGHNRATTIGEDSDENAHPFIEDNLVVFHNGTLRDKQFQHKTQSDSMMLAKAIKKDGLVSSLSFLDEKSAFCVVVYDKLRKSLTVTRNTKRSFYFALNKTRKVMYYSSCLHDLRYALSKNGVTQDMYDSYMVKPNTIITWNDVRVPDKYTVSDLETPPFVENYGAMMQ